MTQPDEELLRECREAMQAEIDWRTPQSEADATLIALIARIDARLAQPEELTQEKPMRVFVCSNDACRAIYVKDPKGHCQKCIAKNGVGFSTYTVKIEDAAQPEAAEPLAILRVTKTRLGYALVDCHALDAAWTIPEGGYRLYAASPASAPQAAERDAARYRWLRDDSNHAPNDTPTVFACLDGNGGPDGDVLFGDTLDTAIDAAIAQAKEKP